MSGRGGGGHVRTVAGVAVAALVVVGAVVAVVTGQSSHSRALALDSGTAWFWSPRTNQAVELDGSTVERL